MKVLIIEDDPMVAMIHQEYFKRKELDYKVDHVFSLRDSEEYLKKNIPDLIVLDNYLSDGQGVNFIPKLKGYPIVMITAANDIQTVEVALTNGVIDYLVKPFTYERFSQAIDKAKDFLSLLSKNKVSQAMLDEYLNSSKDKENTEELPKGLSKITLKKIIDSILKRKENFTTQQIAEEIEISRITIRKYLNYLVNIGILSEDAEYYTSGRPVSVFNVVSKNKIQELI
ncbi:response regulator [Gemella cuniculi]|uniref:response regulator n=1 Tax=Gemella cuniculi TaxID=150240 RepID=UPI000403F0F6|nr:response regulator [Gemella cuniculi]